MSKKIGLLLILNVLLIGLILFLFGYRPHRDFIYKEHMTSYGAETYTILYDNDDTVIVRFDDTVYEIIEFEDTWILPKEKYHRFDIYGLIETYPSYTMANMYLNYYEIPIQSDNTFEYRANYKPTTISEDGDAERDEITLIFVYNTTQEDIELRSYDPSLDNPTYQPIATQRMDLDANSYLLIPETPFIMDDNQNITPYLNDEVYVAEVYDSNTYQNIRIDGVALDSSIGIQLPSNFYDLLTPLETELDLNQELLHLEINHLDRFKWEKIHDTLTFYKHNDTVIVSQDLYDLQNTMDIDTFNKLMTYIHNQMD